MNRLLNTRWHCLCHTDTRAHSLACQTPVSRMIHLSKHRGVWDWGHTTVLIDATLSLWLSRSLSRSLSLPECKWLIFPPVYLPVHQTASCQSLFVVLLLCLPTGICDSGDLFSAQNTNKQEPRRYFPGLPFSGFVNESRLLFSVCAFTKSID